MREQRTKVTRSGVYWRGRELDKEEIERRRQTIYLQEFPREAIKEVVCILLGYDVISHHPDIDLAIDKIERFWNAPNTKDPNVDTEEGRKILDELAGLGVLSSTRQAAQAASLLSDRAVLLLYGECPTCEGREKVCPPECPPTGGPCDLDELEHLATCPALLPCPDCTRPQSLEEAAQRSRASAERAGERCLKCGVARWESTSLCNHVYVDQRKGKRRQIYGHLRHQQHKNGEAATLYLTGHYRMEVWLPSRRIGDERRK